MARLLSKALGWPVFDKELLRAMAGDDAVREQLYASMDECDMSWLEEALCSLTHEEVPRNNYLHRLMQTVLAIARGANAIFIGRATELILPRNVGLRVRIVAPLKQRIRRYADRREVTMEQAGREIEATDRKRARFAENHFGRLAHDPCRFDMIVNRQHYEPSEVVSLILFVLKLRGIVDGASELHQGCPKKRNLPMFVANWMTRNPRAICEDEQIAEAEGPLRHYRFHRLPVVDSAGWQCCPPRHCASR